MVIMIIVDVANSEINKLFVHYGKMTGKNNDFLKRKYMRIRE